MIALKDQRESTLYKKDMRPVMGLDPGLGVLMGAGMVLLDFGDAPFLPFSNVVL